MSRAAKKNPPAEELVVFLGPSLPAAEAMRLARCRVLPPARQGDLWRALALRPRAIALVDGLFEAAPSVWHHEILEALEAGVAVFGGASMGALRAAELSPHGMIGVGRIFGWYRDGAIDDDSEVALLHAGAEHGWEAFTVPLVNVRHAAEQARGARVLSRAEAAGLVEEAGLLHFQERTWARVLEAAARRWRPSRLERWREWAQPGLEDLKRLDAQATIQAAAQYVEAQRAGGWIAPPFARRAPASALVRRRKIEEGLSVAGGVEIPNAEVLGRLHAMPESQLLGERGLRRALLAGWARELGLRPEPGAQGQAEAQWLAENGVRPARRGEFLAASGLDEAGARRLVEELALERLVLAHAQRMLNDGPSQEEGLAAEARLTGLWARLALEAAEKGEPGRRASRRRPL